MSGRQIGMAIRRRLVQVIVEPPEASQEAIPEPPAAADDARLDALRGELVRELDRLAASDQACSAAFRRVA
jgi:hypothetical protein